MFLFNRLIDGGICVVILVVCLCIVSRSGVVVGTGNFRGSLLGQTGERESLQLSR